MFKQMTMEEWEETYQPHYNPLNEYASFQDESGRGIMFETYGSEEKLVSFTPEKYVWTYIDCGDATCIINGYHWVDRIGYFICAVPWEQESGSIEVVVTEGYDEEELQND